MNLGRQIHTLLKRQSSVYVNRLGTFTRVHTPATFDAKRHVYLPPITFVEFDSVATDGYDFVTYIQQVHQLYRTEAESLVEQAVTLILDELTQSGEADLDNLGQLVSYGNSYVFKPLDLSGFNYTAVEDQFHADEAPLDTEKVTISESLEQEIPTSEDTVSVTNEISENVVLEPSEESNSEDKEIDSSEITPASTDMVDNSRHEDELVMPIERKATSAYVYAIVAVLAIALLGGLYYYSTYMQQTPVVAEKKEVIVPMDSILTDTSAAVVHVDSLDINQDTVISAPEPEKVTETEVSVKHRYTIVIGTHRTLAQAYEEAEAFNKDGHKSVRVITPNLAKNLKRVVWDTYATKEERDSALRYVRKHIKTDAWPDVIR